jgi:hypothetical protein
MNVISLLIAASVSSTPFSHTNHTVLKNNYATSNQKYFL